MNNFFILTAIITFFSCSQHIESQNTLSKTENKKVTFAEVVDTEQIDKTFSSFKNPYAIGFEVEKLGNNEYELIVNIQLSSESYFVSPYSKGSYMGRFDLDIDEHLYMELNDDMIELPKATETIDPFTNKPANFVKGEVQYRKRFKVLTNDYFSNKGIIRFVIEPRCTMEEIRFTISNFSGEMKAGQESNGC